MKNLLAKKAIIGWLLILSLVVLIFLLGYSRKNLPSDAKNRGLQSSNGEPVTESHIYGKVLGKSDVFLQTDRPLPDVVILAINANNFEKILQELNTPSGSLPIIDDQVHKKYVTASTISRQDGGYSLQLPEGNYYFCLANIGRNIRLPAYVNGCVEVSINGESQKNIDIYWGEGGVTLK